MTNPRPIQPLCPKGHLKAITTTGARYCKECQKDSNQKRADRLRAERISKRIRPLYT